MYKYLKQLVVLLILLIAVYSAYQFINATHTKNNSSIESKIMDTNIHNSSDEQVENHLSYDTMNTNNESKVLKKINKLDHSQNENKELKIFLNNTEIKLEESEIELEFAYNKKPITSLDKDIFYFKYFDINNTRNGKFYAGAGDIFNSKDEKISKNPCNLMPMKCGQEAGPQTYLLEDGEGFISVCESQYIRIFRMKDKMFQNTQNGFWEIESNGENNEYYFGSEVGLTQDGKYMFISVNENPVKIRKYNLKTKELVSENIIDDKERIHKIFPSPFSDLVFINGNEVYDKDLTKLHKFYFGELQDKDAYPKFFKQNGEEKLLVKGNRCLWIKNLNNTSDKVKICSANSNRIDWFQLVENKLLFQIKTEDNMHNLIELNLEDLSSSSTGKIMKSTNEYKKGSKNTVVEIDGPFHKIYNY